MTIAAAAFEGEIAEDGDEVGHFKLGLAAGALAWRVAH